MTHKLLYLCTGNYYRSRFAEVLFNVEARRRQLDWIADSRGIATELGIDNVGPISIHAVRGLTARGIALDKELRFPLQLQERDLAHAQLIVAINEVEHRPMLGRRFPRWVDAVEYWHVADLDGAEPADALAAIEQETRRLLAKLAGGKSA
jgi:protein-tyrosine phosphatase